MIHIYIYISHISNSFAHIYIYLPSNIKYDIHFKHT
ncbi:hypothetical protein F383_28320 [Gossypium arboreum]|uniref:Uncharacterized protein n=1 Tax=Gossypium arboreum TaxID=29729 RepID=A0A0B0PAG0_GOSAR|nr:hypothetical protein F383_28320 [Gossypium arboreum]